MATSTHTCTTTFQQWRGPTAAPSPFNSDEGPHLHQHPQTMTNAHTSTLKQWWTPIPAPHLQPVMRAHIRTTTFNRRWGPMPVPPPSNGDEGPHPHHHLQTVTSTHTCTTTFQQQWGPTPTPPPSTAMNAHVCTSTLKQWPALTDSDKCLQQQPLAHTSTLMMAYGKCPFSSRPGWKWEGHC